MNLRSNVEMSELKKYGYYEPYIYLHNYYIKQLEGGTEIRIFADVNIDVITPTMHIRSPKLIKKYIKDLIDADLIEE